MPSTRKERRGTTVPVPDVVLGPWARMEDAVQEFREQRARRRGKQPTVIPYTGYGAPGWIRVLGRVLLTRETRTHRPTVRGWRSFTSVPVNDIDVIVTLGGEEHVVRADRGGVVDARIQSPLPPGWHTVLMRPHENGRDTSVDVEAPVYVHDPASGFGIISDIDDTVMVTLLPRPFLAAWNTFVLDEHARNATPGMAVLYDRLARFHPGSPVVYVSTGAWNVAPTLARFLTRNLYPPGPLLLTDWGPTHDRIFRSGKQHKKDSLTRLAQEFPDVKWLLIGDDGQHDEEIYGEFALAHPERVAAVAIRQLSPPEAVLAGGRSHEENYAQLTAVPWVYGPDGAGIARELKKIGLL